MPSRSNKQATDYSLVKAAPETIVHIHLNLSRNADIFLEHRAVKDNYSSSSCPQDHEMDLSPRLLSLLPLPDEGKQGLALGKRL